VFAIASGDDGVALAMRMGADAAIDGREVDIAYATRAFAPNGVDAALLTAGGEAAERALETLRDGGRVAFPRGVKPRPKGRPGQVVTEYVGDHASPDDFGKLNWLIESGPFEVHLARTFPLEQAAEAHRALDAHHLGKLALRPNGN
jgi:NADPH2:quinone reductase